MLTTDTSHASMPWVWRARSKDHFGGWVLLEHRINFLNSFRCNYYLDHEDGGKVDWEEDRDGGDEVPDCEEVEPDGQDAGKYLEQEREVNEECVGHLLDVISNDSAGDHFFTTLGYFDMKYKEGLLMV